MKNKMMYSFYLLLSLTGCVNDDLISNKASSEYFPNTIGNYWEYSVIDSTGQAGIGVKRYNVSVTITGTKRMSDGKDAFIWKYQYPTWVNWYSNYPNGVDTLFVRIENDTAKIFQGGYFLSKRALMFPKLTYPLPFQNDKKWNGKLLVVDSYSSTETSEGYLIKYYYLGPNLEYKDKMIFKPSIGFTHLDKIHYDLGITEHQIWQLEKYSLK